MFQNSLYSYRSGLSITGGYVGENSALYDRYSSPSLDRPSKQYGKFPGLPSRQSFHQGCENITTDGKQTTTPEPSRQSFHQGCENITTDGKQTTTTEPKFRKPVPLPRTKSLKVLKSIEIPIPRPRKSLMKNIQTKTLGEGDVTENYANGIENIHEENSLSETGYEALRWEDKNNTSEADAAEKIPDYKKYVIQYANLCSNLNSNSTMSNTSTGCFTSESGSSSHEQHADFADAPIIKMECCLHSEQGNSSGSGSIISHCRNMKDGKSNILKRAMRYCSPKNSNNKWY